jgi:CelD/BcsL family acetyltransferase involved in cellulose biosynthesis
MIKAILIEGEGGFIRLETAWDELAGSVSTSRYTQTFQWCQVGWQTRHHRENDRLICATVWDDEQLIAVWPFMSRQGPFGMRIDPLGCGSEEEYGDPLIADHVDHDHICRKLLDLLKTAGDLMHVPFVENEGPMKRALASSGLYRLPIPVKASAVRRKRNEGFDKFLRGYPSDFRASLKQKRKQLDKLGQLRFELPDDSESYAATVDWVIEEKQDWLLRNQKRNPWFFEDATRHFFLVAATQRSCLGRIGLFRLILDGKTIAAFLATIDRTRIEVFVTSFDPAYARFSPATLLIEDTIRWGFERGLSFDMRVQPSQDKDSWANVSTDYVSYFAPLSLMGAVRFLPTFLKIRAIMLLKASLNVEQVEALKRIVRWPIGLLRRVRASLTQIVFRQLREE